MVIETEGCLSIPGFKADVCRYWAIEVEGFQPNGQRKTWSVKGGRHASFNMKSITLTDGGLPIACFQERSLRPSRTVQVLRPTYSNASPFRPNRPRKNEEITRGDSEVGFL